MKKIPLIVNFSRTPQDLIHKINNNWFILQTEPKLKKTFNNPSIVVFERNKNLRDFIGDNKLDNNKKLIHAKTFDKGKSYPCLTRMINICYKQIIPTCLCYYSGKI